MSKKEKQILLADIDGCVVNFDGGVEAKAIALAVRYGLHQNIGFVTGREYAHVNKTTIAALNSALEFEAAQPSYRIPVACEYGAQLAVLEGGIWSTDEFRHPPTSVELRQEVSEIAESFPRLIFHERKQVVLTVGIPSGSNTVNEESLAELEGAAKRLSHVAEAHGLALQRTTKAIDLTPPTLDKAFGAGAALDWLALSPTFIRFIGDAKADLLMAEPAIQQSADFEFWYVGKPEEVTPEMLGRYNVKFPKQQYVAGTVEVLSNLVGNL